MSNVRLDDLLGYIAQGRIMDAMNEFYGDGVVMEEPMYGRTEGLAANLVREEKFVGSIKEFKSFEVLRKGTSETSGFYESTMDWIGVDGVTYHIEQVAVQEWQDGKIVYERFYYNMG
ncbi:hypothetical protein [Armatimonas sp.]|uniref:hypothetical protein n=1 Tax=Armatimonas sp. TaxID=1872638 RepID=UPI00286A4238|nr:hypothetical protein [Armatimonas sp.]